MFAIAQMLRLRVSASSIGCTSKLGARIFHARPKTFHVSRSYAPNHHAYMRATTARVSMAAVGIGISALSLSFAPSKIHCDAERPALNAAQACDALPPSPQSSVQMYELTFGTLCGVCAGIFLKKGAKAVAFLVGGVFVLLQYLGSFSLVRIDWSRAATRFENAFYTKNPDGNKSAMTVYGLGKWLVDFLTADFQQRASFVAGLALGLRIG